MVKYEDIVGNPQKLASKMYGFMNRKSGLNFAVEYIKSHSEAASRTASFTAALSLAHRKIRLETQWRRGQISKVEFEKARENSSYVPKLSPEEEREKRLKKYYGTVRSDTFRHDHWRQEIRPELLRELYSNEECLKVLKLLEYK